MNASKVGRRGQITIPHGTCQALDIQEGDCLAFVYRGDEVIL
ncbi:AbrB/MazE/SpoVT family DNA-binding domain-containing protein [Acaryochloris thomasi]